MRGRREGDVIVLTKVLRSRDAVIARKRKAGHAEPGEQLLALLKLYARLASVTKKRSPRHSTPVDDDDPDARGPATATRSAGPPASAVAP